MSAAPAPSLSDMTTLEALTMLRDVAADPMADLRLAVAASIISRGYAGLQAERLAARAENCAKIAEDSPDFTDAQRWRKRSQRLAAEATELRKFAAGIS